MATRKAKAKSGEGGNARGSNVGAAKKAPRTKAAGAAASSAAPSAAPSAAIESIDEYLAQLQPERAAAIQRLRALIRQAAPAAREVVRWSRPVWEMNGPFCWARAAPGHLELGLWRGRQINDPGGLLEGTARAVAHLRIDDEGAWPEEALLDFVRQGIELDRRYGDPTRVGS